MVTLCWRLAAEEKIVRANDVKNDRVFSSKAERRSGGIVLVHRMITNPLTANNRERLALGMTRWSLLHYLRRIEER